MRLYRLSSTDEELFWRDSRDISSLVVKCLSFWGWKLIKITYSKKRHSQFARGTDPQISKLFLVS